MFYLIFGWLLLGLISSVVGDILLSIVVHKPSTLSNRDRSLISLWLGVGTLSLGLLSVSLVMPLTPALGSVLAALVLAIGAFRKQFGAIGWHWTTRQVVTFIVTIVGVAAWCNRPIVWLDTGYYHYSLIQWLGTYGTVPGLALLFNNLGFTSSWFALTTPFNPVMLAGKPLALTNGFAFLLLLGQGYSGVMGLQGQRRLADWFNVAWCALLIPLILFLDPLSKILRSPSPDLPVTILVGVIAWVILRLSSEASADRTTADLTAADRTATNLTSEGFLAIRSIPWALALIAVTFKLIALPLLPVTFLFAIWRQSYSAWIRTIATGILILSPMVLGNLITSGCPLFPGHVLCLDLPWSPTIASLNGAAISTHGWTTWYGTPPPGANPWLWSLGQWFMSSSKEKITALGIGLGVLVAGWMVIRSAIGQKSAQKIGQKSRDRVGDLWVCGIGFLGLAFIMATSPFFRFSAPYILVLLAIGLARLLDSKWGKRRSGSVNSDINFDLNQRISKPALIISLALVMLCISLERRNLLLPPSMSFSSIWVTKETNGIVYRSPKSGDVVQEKVVHKDMCWTAEIPCSYGISADIHLRDPVRGIGGGFVRR